MGRDATLALGAPALGAPAQLSINPPLPTGAGNPTESPAPGPVLAAHIPNPPIAFSASADINTLINNGHVVGDIACDRNFSPSKYHAKVDNSKVDNFESSFSGASSFDGLTPGKAAAVRASAAMMASFLMNYSQKKSMN